MTGEAAGARAVVLGEPLRERIEALTDLHGAGRQVVLAAINAERRAAGPVWSGYWEALLDGLDPDS